MTQARRYRIVFAVCHPDDEAIWVGGLLHELSEIPYVQAYVVCLSGRDPNSPRDREFEAARKAAGYAGGIVLGFPLRPAPQPLPATSQTLQEGLKLLRLEVSDVDLLLTHSPYGDEQLHPHHVQTHRELKSWSAEAGVPFGYFSCLPIPQFRHTPILTEVRRSGTLHLLHLSRCSHVLSSEDRKSQGVTVFDDCPSYYLQFLTDRAAKLQMLSHYSSIGLESHARNYTMFTNPCEAIYLMDDKAYQPFGAIIEDMKVPAAVQILKLPEPSPAVPDPSTTIGKPARSSFWRKKFQCLAF
jgi:LmbE family N-acetylglucosaminyl deacetylase